MHRNSFQSFRSYPERIKSEFAFVRHFSNTEKTYNLRADISFSIVLNERISAGAFTNFGAIKFSPVFSEQNFVLILMLSMGKKERDSMKNGLGGHK